MKNWVLAAILIISGASVLMSCSNSDDSAMPDVTSLVEWQAGETVSAEAVEAYGGIDINTLYNPYIKTLSDGTLLIQPVS